MGAIKGVDWMMLEVPDASLLLAACYIPKQRTDLLYKPHTYLLATVT